MPAYRLTFVIAILAFYVAHVLGGQAVHVWQCSAGACCGEASSEQHRHAHCDHHGHSHEEYHDDEPVPGENERHDSSDCWVCQVLAQAQDKPVEVQTTVALAVSRDTVVLLPDFIPSPSPSGFQSRAPPVS